MGHIDGSIVPTHFSEVGQGSTVIEVEMTAGGEEEEEMGIMVGPLNPAFVIVVQTYKGWKNSPHAMMYFVSGGQLRMFIACAKIA